jgi:TRAP-type mannitol/chloroaromatic compound transport system permease small subunit
MWLSLVKPLSFTQCFLYGNFYECVRQEVMIMFKMIDNFVQKICSFVWLFLLALLPVCVVVSSGNAFVRKISDAGSNAFLELQWVLYSAIFLLATGYVLKKDGHIRIDIFYARMKPLTQAWMNLILHSFITVPVVCFVIYVSLPFFFSSFMATGQEVTLSNLMTALFDGQHHEISPNAGGLKTWYAKMLLPLGFFFLLLSVISTIINNLKIVLRVNNKEEGEW